MGVYGTWWHEPCLEHGAAEHPFCALLERGLRGLGAKRGGVPTEPVSGPNVSHELPAG